MANIVPPLVKVDGPEGQISRSSTFPIVPIVATLPPIDENDVTPLERLLRIHGTKHADSSNSNFWSLELLRHILSRRRVQRQLESYKGNAIAYLDQIRPEADPPTNSNAKTYIKIFALLILIDKGDEIGNFVEESVSDETLPLGYRRHDTILYRKDSPNVVLACFNNWQSFMKDYFAITQWKVVIPYFALGPENDVNHYDLEDNTILPWIKQKDPSPPSSSSKLSSSNRAYSNPTQHQGGEGGYASVSCVQIDPLSHDFQSVLQSIYLYGSLFAVKTLHDKHFNDKRTFENEAGQLRRFSGLVHDHLVTLLATYILNKRFSFIFPYAEYDLESYWKFKEPIPRMDAVTVRWVSNQCAGIMAAIHTMHEPKHLRNLDVPRFCRHGDIKPDNILWFRSPNDVRGILVVSDMGLSSFNRITSRSNIPNADLPVFPTYRPPECDVKGGSVSRLFDVWTLGCLFLDLLTWLLGGSELVEDFSESRFSLYIHGAENDMFFEHKRLPGSNTQIIQVKETVTKWFLKLHSLENCTDFVHDALDIIEENMLVVLSADGRKRSPSSELRVAFDALSDKCADEAYCMRGNPKFRILRAATGVVADLDENAARNLREHRPDLRSYVGRPPRRSMQPDELKSIK